jgi:kojibiose phosphorylase
MSDFLKPYIPESGWFVKEEGFDKHKQTFYETIFTLGNGYMGTRGVLEEIPYDAYPGTYIAGVYDKTGSFVTELVNLPNPWEFKITVGGEKLDLVAMDFTHHWRMLNFRHGLLLRSTIFKTAQGKKFQYQSLRFLSYANPHMGCMRIWLTSLDEDTDIIVQNVVDTAVYNKGMVMEGRKKHFQVEEISQRQKLNYLEVKTFDTQISVGYSWTLEVEREDDIYITPERMLHLKIKQGETICFTQYFSIYSTREVKKYRLKSHAVKTAKIMVNAGFDEVLKQHHKAMEKNWDLVDIRIKAPEEVQAALRFNIYHLLILGHPEVKDVSIPARGLSGEGYRGHIFWDAEIFALPFFIYNFPQVAREFLLYRYRRLSQARENAKKLGYKGARFPWESAESGVETTPPWHRDLDGTIIEIKTGQLEEHINPDIVYAIYHYYLVTNDREFLFDYGLEIIFEIARYLASRVVWNDKKNAYIIPQVIGPDEFHEGVDNNAFTNYMSKWALMIASDFYFKFKDWENNFKFIRLVQKLELSDEEVEEWREKASKIWIPRKGELIEEFEGYFRKKDVKVTEFDEHGLPLIPRGISPRDLKETKLVKQPDVLMLIYLLRDEFPYNVIKTNFLYYDKRTLHKSSLSPSISAIVALMAKNYIKAYKYFLISLYADIKNLHGNTSEGIHTANIGGCWQVVVMGFAGLRGREDGIYLEPHLPRAISQLEFKIRYRNNLLAIRVRSDKIDVSLVGKDKARIKVSAFGKEKILTQRKVVLEK